MRLSTIIVATTLLGVPALAPAEGNRIPAGKTMKEAGCIVRQAFTPPGKWLNAAPIIECPKVAELAHKGKDSAAAGNQSVRQD